MGLRVAHLRRRRRQPSKGGFVLVLAHSGERRVGSGVGWGGFVCLSVCLSKYNIRQIRIFGFSNMDLIDYCVGFFFGSINLRLQACTQRRREEPAVQVSVSISAIGLDGICSD